MHQHATQAPPVFKTRAGQEEYIAAYNRVLQQWPVAYNEIQIPTKLGATHIIASGTEDAPPLFLLPSLAGSALLWRPNVAALSDTFRVYAIDTIGQAGKSEPNQRLKSRQLFVDWLNEIMRALSIQKTSIAGASYGGFLAVNQAISAAESVDKIVLISPAGTFVGGLLWRFIKGRIIRLLTGNKKITFKDILGKNATIAPEDTDYETLMNIMMNVSAFPNLTAPIVFSDTELRNIQAPVLLLIGENEIIYSPEKVFKRAQSLVPNIQTKLIQHAHHLAGLAAPAEVNKYMLEFLLSTNHRN